MQNSEHVITSKHYLVLCVISFVSGIFSFVVFSISFNAFICIILLVALFSLLILFIVIPLIRKKSIKLKKHIILPSVLAIFFILGMLRPVFFENSSSKTLRNYTGESLRIYGYVDTVPRLSKNGYSYSFELNVSYLEKDGQIIPSNGTVLMYLSSSFGEAPKFSEHISCWASIEDSESRLLPEDYDYLTYLKSENIFVIGEAKGFTIVPPAYKKPFSLFSSIKSVGIYIHNKISFAIDEMFLYDTNDKALLKGILLGDKSDMSEDFKQMLSNAGISHIAAVSGMHMSILFAAITYILMQFKINKKIVLLLSLPVILLFASTAAFTSSVCRAAIMIVIMILSTLSRERYMPLNSLFMAIAVILIISPYTLFSSGFILSCFSVAGIFVYFKYIKYLLGRIIPSKSLLSPLANSVALSISTFIGTAYFCITFFDSVSLIQCLTNLWVIPLVSIVFCAAYPLCIAYFILPAGILNPLLYVVAGALRIISETARVFGADAFSLKISADALPGFFHAIYFGFAIILYFSLKFLYDRMETVKKSNRHALRQQIKIH